MRKGFDAQLEQLKNEMIVMGSLIETSIAMAIKALIEQNKEQAQKTIAFDEQINQKEKDIEALCLKLILQQQPVAKDLRTVSAALKMITDMERIGDQAADISEIALLLADSPYIKKLEHISLMAEETAKMVTNAVDAYVQRNLVKARNVIDADDIVDSYFDAVKDDLIGMISKDVRNGSQAMDLLMIAKYFERIGDHAVNIAEWVEFSITGVHRQSL
ncbi:MAG TPA: phosphate transport system regulatory protein PhoU [Firmicutes bacterium]|jgi:phosphate transport system protein|nr:phosphate transport system regulatory protein PhoU [Bacillota bacterium]